MRITAVCAGVGALVGGLLVVVLRFVVGQSVLDGVGTRGGMPRRYADYLPTAGGSSLDLVRMLPVGLGAGLVAGLFVGVTLRWVAMRRAAGVGRRLGAAGLALCGVLVGLGVAVELHAYGRSAVPGGDFGWYAYSPLSDSGGSDGIFYGGGLPVSGWPLLITGAAVGLVVGSAAALVTARRRTGLRGSTSPSV